MSESIDKTGIGYKNYRLLDRSHTISILSLIVGHLDKIYMFGLLAKYKKYHNAYIQTLKDHSNKSRWATSIKKHNLLNQMVHHKRLRWLN